MGAKGNYGFVLLVQECHQTKMRFFEALQARRFSVYVLKAVMKELYQGISADILVSLYFFNDFRKLPPNSLPPSAGIQATPLYGFFDGKRTLECKSGVRKLKWVNGPCGSAH